MKENQTEKTGKKQAAIYARTSKEDRNEKAKVSIEQQIQDGQILAEKNGYEVKPENIFVDRDLSGKLYPTCWSTKKGKTRPSFSKLIEAIEAKKIDCLIIRSLDRMARNTVLSLKFLETLSDYGVGLFGTHENIIKPDSASGRFTLTILIACYQFQLEKIMSDGKSSYDYRKRNRLNLMGSKSLGYINVDRKIVIEEKEAALVNQIYDKFLAGDSIIGICEWLNATHFEMKKGSAKAWYHTTVTAILDNPAYIDKACQPFPQIVDTEKWLNVQAQRKARLNTKIGLHSKEHLASGFLTCAVCGKKLIAFARKGITEYKCRETHKEQKSQICREIYWNEFFNKVVSSAKLTTVKMESKEANELDIKRDKIEKNLEALKDSFSKADIDLKMFQELKNSIEKELARIDKALRDIQALTVADKSKIKLWEEMTLNEKRERINATIDYIRVSDKGVSLKYKTGIETVSLDLINAEKTSNEIYFFPYLKRDSGKGGVNHYQRAILPESYDIKAALWDWITIDGVACLTPMEQAQPESQQATA